MLIIAVFAVWRVFWTPDALFVLLLAAAFAYGLTVEFLKAFVPFIGLLVTYDGLRGLVPFVSKHVHYWEMINFDRIIAFGNLPTVWLQSLLYHGHLRWYDFYFYALYCLHFAMPVLVGVLIWRRQPKQYWSYMWSFLALSYAGFITYIAFPAAPPWLASQMNLIPPVEKLSSDIWWAMGIHNYPTIYESISPNAVAAVPSLHSAYPLLMALFIWKLFGKRWGLLSMIYPLSMWFGVVYMGEHYVFDVIIGALYAIAAFIVTPKLVQMWKHRRHTSETTKLELQK